MKGAGIQSAHEARYEVVWPLGKHAAGPSIEPGSPVPDLNGKTVGELWTWGYKGDRMFPIIRERLRQRFPDIKFVDYHTFGNIHGHNEEAVIAALPSLLEQHGCEVVIAGVGS